MTEEQLTQICVDIAIIKTETENINRRLDTEFRCKGHECIEKDIKKLRNNDIRRAGIATGAGTVGGAIAGFIVKWLFK